jgi:hypothetical protein
MKVQAKVYRGIEFITIGDLPTGQQLLLQHNREPERIKILVDGKVLKNCIQYSEYDRWYTSVYKRSVASVSIDPKAVPEEALQLNVSLHNS